MVSKEKFVDTVIYGAIFGIGFIGVYALIRYLNAATGTPIPNEYLASQEMGLGY